MAAAGGDPCGTVRVAGPWPGCPRPCGRGTRRFRAGRFADGISPCNGFRGAGGRFDGVVSSHLRTRGDETVMSRDTAGPVGAGGEGVGLCQVLPPLTLQALPLVGEGRPGE